MYIVNNAFYLNIWWETASSLHHINEQDNKSKCYYISVCLGS